MLTIANGDYKSRGLTSHRNLEPKSFDLNFSQAVLEHIWRNEFKDTFVECHRLLKQD